MQCSPFTPHAHLYLSLTSMDIHTHAHLSLFAYALTHALQVYAVVHILYWLGYRHGVLRCCLENCTLNPNAQTCFPVTAKGPFKCFGNTVM